MTQDSRSLGRGVVVLGMHRSGTSAVTGIIDSLGLPACRQDDRFPVRRWNARGNYESASLSTFDESLLTMLGGCWYAPPLPATGWATRSELGSWRSRAKALFSAAHPSGRWAWKDPRACVLMPFWDLVLGTGVPRIVVLRNPLESAASLFERNSMSLSHSLALAERSLRTSLRDSQGHPALITVYDDVLEGVDSWCLKAADFLAAKGLSLADPLPVAAARSFLDESLRHHRSTRDLSSEPAAEDGLKRIWAWAMERRGAHQALSIEGLPPESPETDDVLRAARAGLDAMRSTTSDG
jgi:hypothetical protein